MTLTPLLVHPRARPLLVLLCALPLAGLVVAAVTDALGPNPAEALIRDTGEWALRFLWLTLAITPLRVLLQQPALLRFRRVLGLATFAYAVLHLLAYAWLDQGWVLDEIVRDVLKRDFILVGMLALLLMTPLALTSFNAAVRALGGRRWQAVHRLVYGAALLVLLHYYLKQAGKNDWAEVGVYGAVLAALLGWRFGRWASKIR